MENQELDISIDHLLRRAPEGQETIFDLLDEAGETVKTIEIKRRKLQPEIPQPMPEPDIARARARDHVFNGIDTFAEYLNREADKLTSVVLADVDQRQCLMKMWQTIASK